MFGLFSCLNTLPDVLICLRVTRFVCPQKMPGACVDRPACRFFSRWPDVFRPDRHFASSALAVSGVGRNRRRSSDRRYAKRRARNHCKKYIRNYRSFRLRTALARFCRSVRKTVSIQASVLSQIIKIGLAVFGWPCPATACHEPEIARRDCRR